MNKRDVGHIEAPDANSLLIRGELSFDSVPALNREATALIERIEHTASPLRIDLSAVSRADSAGLALLMQCLRLGRRRGRVVHFQGLPAQLVAIARASGLEGLLGEAH